MARELPRILSLSTRDLEGGAARAAYRLHQGLREAGVEARLLVRQRDSDDPSVVWRGQSAWVKAYDLLEPWADRWRLLRYPRRRRDPWSVNGLPGLGLRRVAERFGADLVHLHWVGDGYLSPARLTAWKVPLVWTLHDMWPFTGGCHYADGCGRYQSGCGHCPSLRSGRLADLSRWTWRRKARHWAGLDLTLVCPSRWMAECARRSVLFRDRPIEVIPNGLDCQRFRPLDRSFCKRLLGFSAETRLLLFGAMAATSDRKKGFAYLAPALRRFAATPGARGCELLIFGASRPADAVDFGLPDHYLGRLHDDLSLAVIYAAADLLIVPSTQDNLPNTVMEAMACGTPVVAFAIGGIPDLIDHRSNGFLVSAFDTAELAEGLAWVLADAGRWRALSAAARHKVERNYALPAIVARHLALYERILAGRTQPV